MPLYMRTKFRKKIKYLEKKLLANLIFIRAKQAFISFINTLQAIIRIKQPTLDYKHNKTGNLFCRTGSKECK